MKSNKRQKKKDELRRRNIQAAMVRRGIVGAEIARKLGINRQMISNVVAGRDVSGRVVQALIDAGVPAEYFREARYGWEEQVLNKSEVYWDAARANLLLEAYEKLEQAGRDLCSHFQQEVFGNLAAALKEVEQAKEEVLCAG